MRSDLGGGAALPTPRFRPKEVNVSEEGHLLVILVSHLLCTLCPIAPALVARFYDSFN